MPTRRKRRLAQGGRPMRGFVLIALALVWLTVPAGAESHPRFNGTYDRIRHKPHDHDACGCREETVPGSFHWVRNSGVDARSQRTNRFRAIHSGVIWRARAFPGSMRVRGFHGRGGHRGHGRKW